MRSRGSDKSYRTKTYDLILTFDNKNNLEFHNFSDYKLAKKVLEKLREISGVETEDNVKRKEKPVRSTALGPNARTLPGTRQYVFAVFLSLAVDFALQAL